MSKKKSKKQTNRRGLLAFGMVAVLGVAALAAYVKYAPANKLHPEEKKDAPVVSSQTQKTIKVPKPEYGRDEKLRFDLKESSVPAGADARVEAAQQFLTTSGVVNDSAKVESIEIDHGVAKLQLSSGSEFSFGSQDESTFLLGLRATLGQFPEVDAVELYINGQKINELGHIELELPMPVIRPANWHAPTKPAEETRP